MSTPKKPGKAQQLLEMQLRLASHLLGVAELLRAAGEGTWTPAHGKDLGGLVQELEVLHQDIRTELDGPEPTSGN